MAFRNILFPECISFGATGGPGFSTEVIIFGSGSESRNANWLRNRSKWDVSHAGKLQKHWEQLRAFFHVVGGRRDSWLFKDPLDNIATSAEGILLPIDSGHWQLAKRYTFGGVTYDHPIYKPLVDSVTFSGGGEIVVDTAGYTTGVVLETSAGISETWAGSFYKPARFDTDEPHGQIVDKNPSKGLIVSFDSIPIIEVRAEPPA